MSVISKVGHFFEVVGSHVRGAFITIFGDQAGAQLAGAAEQWAKTELGAAAITVVKGLEAAALDPTKKKSVAFAGIVAALGAQGKAVPNSLINFAIEFALQIVRGSAKA